MRELKQAWEWRAACSRAATEDTMGRRGLGWGVEYGQGKVKLSSWVCSKLGTQRDKGLLEASGPYN